MYLAIADDQAADLRAAADFIRNYIAQQHPESVGDLRLDTFVRSEDLLAAFEPHKYDLIILDIYMETVTGMQAAETIRALDKDVQIIFLTTSTEHLLAGYRVFAVGYFVKPLADNREEFAKTFDHIFPHLTDRQKSIGITVRGVKINVPYRNIHYADIRDKRLCLHLAADNLSTNDSYEACRAKLLSDDRFVECHHRIIVNMDYVARMSKEDFILTSGENVPISQRRKTETKLAYMSYLAHR